MIAFARGARARGERPRHLRAPPGTDERLVEVPWVLARLRSGRVLEVGYAFAEPAYIAALIDAAPGELVGVDLAEAEVPGFETVVADARELPFPDAPFDQVARGLDARAHRRGQRGVRRRRRAATPRDGRRRSASCGASCDPTAPARDRAAGRAGDYGWFRQEDVRGWTRLFTVPVLRRGAGGVRARRRRLARRRRRSTRRASSTACAARRPPLCSAPSSADDGCAGSLPGRHPARRRRPGRPSMRLRPRAQ